MPGNEENKKPELFGPYEIYERIGVGGMATVHRAKKQGIEGFQRVVALKRMLSHLADDETFIKSFVREARLASQLQHANIIQIYDLGRVGRVYYIAMEHVRGRDLRKILKQTAYATGPMPLPMMLTLTRQLCDALDYAHNLVDDNGEPLGLVHRDISPSNILIAADGHLKIIDFGIAKATSTSLRTLSGRVKGKFAYMAPEAIQGKKLDRRTDVFAMGIVAHEMLTARPLFAAKNQFDTIRKITQGPVDPPSRHNPACPAELDEIVLTALAKSPDERWQSAGAMHRALDHVAKKRGLQATNREIAEWIEWAFEQPLQSKRIEPGRKPTQAQAGHTVHPDPVTSPMQSSKQPTLRSAGQVAPVDNVDSASIELVWGGRNPGRSKRPSAPLTDARTPSGAGASSDSGAQAVPLLHERESQPVEAQTGMSDAVPRPTGGAGSASVRGSRNGVGDSSGQVPQTKPDRPARGDASQPYRVSPTTARDDSQRGAMTTDPRGIAAQQAVQQPADPRNTAARQAAQQSTMLGIAPPPGQTWSVPRFSRELGAQPPPARDPSARFERPTGAAPAARTPPAKSSLRTGFQIALFVILCAGAAVGGYFLVVALTGG